MLAVACVLAGCGSKPPPASEHGTVARVVDGDTIRLAGGARVRLVQIDAPETTFARECFGVEATAAARRLLPPGTRVRLEQEPRTDSVDDFGRLLRYVVRERDGLDVNVDLVARGAAAPYFYRHRRGRRAATLERVAHAARAARLGLWGACPQARYDPARGLETGPASR